MSRLDKPSDGAWEHLRSEPGDDLHIFRLRFDWFRHPRSAKALKVVVLDAPDWANVVALTPEKKIVVVRQFRFGAAQTTVEIPAGLVERGEAHERAVRRELEEETGYRARVWQYLGNVEPNPAFMNNHCHQWLALDVARSVSPHPDENEDIRVDELSLDEIKTEIRAGRMRNALTLLSLSRVFDLRDEPGLLY